ncbi:MAG: helix-turn-helix domain-containing protein [Pseudonocardiaceae bacterium]|nr:helix-turn-helix domain-containing protein [Pseudonocardiaceae bacterium]
MATASEITQLANTLAQLAQTITERENETAETTPEPEATQRVMLTVEQAAQRLGIGRTLMYRLVSDCEVTSVRIGRLRRIPATAVAEYAEQLANVNNPTHHAA